MPALDSTLPTLAVVTGGGSGIGRALALQLANQDIEVLIAGRRRDPLEETRAAASGMIHPCPADLATPEGRSNVVQAVHAWQQDSGGQLRFLVHNAATVQPIKRPSEIELDEWRSHQQINVEAPIFLTQALLPELDGGGRVLHLSSGAAHKPYGGWTAYCTSKAALHMLYLCLRDELKPRGIYVGSARPGVVDTPMQTELRASDEVDFPSRPRFVALKEDGGLYTPERSARFLRWLLLNVDAERFVAQEWDARDEDHHAEWDR